MLLKTYELRWFWPADDFNAVLDWFTAGSELPREQRIDRYLQLPECTTTGIKLREDRLEVKSLVREVGDCQLPYRLTGKLQSWLKWSIVVVSFEDSLYAQVPVRHWTALHKERWQYHYSTAGMWQAGLAEASPADEKSCTVELTRLKREAGLHDWLSFAFESMAEQSQPRQAIELAADQFLSLRGEPPTGLRTAVSHSYPAWLMEQKD